jgi:hypothetical protein
MRLNNQINEEIEEIDPVIVKNLQKVNQDYLKDVKSLLSHRLHYITRGMSVSQKYMTKNVRQDRIPTDSSIEWHNALDDELFEKFGVKARSKSAFCSRLSAGYGTMYAVFPIGGFFMLYSPVYPDLYLEEPKHLNKSLVYSENPDIIKERAKEVISTVKKSNSWAGMFNNIGPTTEIMLVCKSYFAVRVVTKKEIDPLDNWIRDNIK